MRAQDEIRRAGKPAATSVTETISRQGQNPTVDLAAAFSSPKRASDRWHGSSFTGDCARALGDLDVALRELFGPQK